MAKIKCPCGRIISIFFRSQLKRKKYCSKKCLYVFCPKPQVKPEPKSKVCTRCKVKKKINEFYFKKSNTGQIKHISRCISCKRKIDSERNKLTYKLDPEKFKRRQNLYRLNNLEKIKNQKKILYSRNRELVLNHYGSGYPKCSCCGEKEKKFLEIDHINGGGSKERKKIGGGSTFYSYLISHKYPKGFQLLCSNCNQAKGKYGICPHKLK